MFREVSKAEVDALLEKDARLTCVQENPHVSIYGPNYPCWIRDIYECYKKATSARQSIELGASKEDIMNGLARGLIILAEPLEGLPSAPVPARERPVQPFLVLPAVASRAEIQFSRHHHATPVRTGRPYTGGIERRTSEEGKGFEVVPSLRDHGP